MWDGRDESSLNWYLGWIELGLMGSCWHVLTQSQARTGLTDPRRILGTSRTSGLCIYVSSILGSYFSLHGRTCIEGAHSPPLSSLFHTLLLLLLLLDTAAAAVVRVLRSKTRIPIHFFGGCCGVVSLCTSGFSAKVRRSLRLSFSGETGI
jgi:hypothetical protein